MDDPGFLAALLPLWIIGAPLLWGLVSMVSTPRRRAHGVRPDRGAPQAPARPGGYNRPVTPTPVMAPRL